MCGIIGYTGKKQVLPILLEGLARLEYRGYDSAGVAVFHNQNITISKTVGKVERLREVTATTSLHGTQGIGHTRWATHGGVTDSNAHPHSDGQDNTVSLIHNGIIENYQQLKADLIAKGHTFSSETDTEVLAHLVRAKYDELVDGLRAMGLGMNIDDTVFFEAVRKALALVEGAYAVVVMHRNHPDCIIAARLFSPLIIGLGDGENFVASDIPAILDHTKQVMDIDDHTVAKLTPHTVLVTDLHGNPVAPTTRTIDFSLETAEKQGYHHFLIKEIHESPRVVRDVLRGKIDAGASKLIPDAMALEPCKAHQVDHIQLVACGTAHYATLIGKYLFEEWAHVQAEAVTASEYRYNNTITRPSSLVVGVSQSGETADTLAGLRKVRDLPHLGIMGLTNVVGSSMTRLLGNEHCLMLNAGPEISVASTKAFTSMVVVLATLALYIAEQRQTLSAPQVSAYLTELLALPTKIEQLLDEKNNIARIAMHYVKWNSMYYIGRGINFPTAMEGALKLKEISYIHAEGYAAGEMKHGPIAVLQQGFPVVAIASASSTHDKMLSNIQEAAARRADIIAIAHDDDTHISEIATHIISVPKTEEPFSPILNNIALQLFAYYTALYKGYSIDNPRSLAKYYPDPDELTEPPKGIDIDKPRNLAKSVTVE